MHLKQALIATAFGAAVIASPLDVQPRSVPQKADHYSVINLDEFDLKANNGTLDKRQWRWCVDNGNQAAICVNTGAAIINTIVAIANGIKAHSTPKTAATMTARWTKPNTSFTPLDPTAIPPPSRIPSRAG